MDYLDILAYVVLIGVYVFGCMPLTGSIFARQMFFEYREAFMVGLVLQPFIIGVILFVYIIFWSIGRVWGS